MFDTSISSRRKHGWSAGACAIAVIAGSALASLPCAVAHAETASSIEVVSYRLTARAEQVGLHCQSSSSEIRRTTCSDSACAVSLSASHSGQSVSGTMTTALVDPGVGATDGAVFTAQLNSHHVVTPPGAWCTGRSFAVSQCSLRVEVPEHVRLTLELAGQTPPEYDPSGNRIYAVVTLNVFDDNRALVFSCRINDPPGSEGPSTSCQAFDLEPGTYMVLVTSSCGADAVTEAGNVHLQASFEIRFRESCLQAPNKVLAGPTQWIAGDGNFEDEANWLPANPGPADRVLFFDNAPTHNVNVETSPRTNEVTIGNTYVTFDLHNNTWHMDQDFFCVDPLPSLHVGGSVSGVGYSGVRLAGGRVVAQDVTLAPGRSELVLTNSPTSPGAELVIEEGPRSTGRLVLGEVEDPDVADESSVKVLNGSLYTQHALLGAGETDFGEIILDGRGAYWNGAKGVVFGGGTGRVAVMSGAKADLPDVHMGLMGGTGALTVTGAESKATCKSLGFRSPTSFPSPNTVSVIEHGTLEVIETLSISGLAVLSVGSGGLLRTRGQVEIADGGSVLAGGGATIQLDGAMVLGDGAAVEVSGSESQLNVGSNVYVDGNSAILAANGNARVEVSGVTTVGLEGPGTLSVLGGRVSGNGGVLGFGPQARGVVDVAAGGEWTPNVLQAGISGDALVSIDDGLVRCMNAFVAREAGSEVEIRMTNGARLVVGNQLFLGMEGTARLVGGSGAEVSTSSFIVGGPGSTTQGFTGAFVGAQPNGASLRKGAGGATLLCDTLTLAVGAVFEAGSVVVGGQGVIQGAGTLNAPLVNDGTLGPGGSEPDTLFIATDYIQTPAGRLHITLGAAHDVLSVGGQATLAGTLDVEVDPTAVAGRFEVLVGHPVVGTFDQVPGGVSVSYTDTSVVVVYESTPTLVSLAHASAEPGRVRLAWYASDPTTSRAEVQRRTQLTEWGTIGTSLLDGTGRFEFIDTDVLAGTRYGYRLRLGGGDEAERLGETWVDVPVNAVFALAGARPNPTPGPVTVAFSLTDASPARLALVDVAGRVVRSREVGGFGPGHHVVNLAGEETLKPGLYFVRLVSRGRVANARVVVTR